MIDAVALDHRTVRIDEDREGEAVGAVRGGNSISSLSDNHQYFGS